MAAESSAATTLQVGLNRADLHSIELPSTFEASESFVIELDNHGEAAHVHLRLDEALSEVASLPTSNHYVRPGATTRVPVSVHDTGPVDGILTIATAYGSQTEDVELTIAPTAGKRRVEVDDSLIERSADGTAPPQPTGSTPSTRPAATGSAGSTGFATGIDTSVLLGGAAVLIILGIVLLFIPGLTIYIGALAVVVGVLAVAYLLLY